MNEEQIKKMIADDFDNFINERLDSAIIFKYIDNLEKENLKLKEQYCERTDCSGRLGNSKKVEELEKEKQELIDYLKEEQNRLARETSAVYEDGLGKRKLVNEEIYNEVSKILSKIEKSDK